MVELATDTPCALVPMMVPALLMPPVKVESASETPVLPVIEPALVMLVVLEFATPTPAPDPPLMFAPAVLMIEPPMVLKPTCTPPVAPAIEPELLMEPLRILLPETVTP